MKWTFRCLHPNDCLLIKFIFTFISETHFENLCEILMLVKVGFLKIQYFDSINLLNVLQKFQLSYPIYFYYSLFFRFFMKWSISPKIIKYKSIYEKTANAQFLNWSLKILSIFWASTPIRQFEINAICEFAKNKIRMK